MNLDEQLAIVIVTRNRRDSLLTTLKHLHSLEAPYPIVVVDNASTDGTVAAVEKNFPNVQILLLDENLGAVARNFGVYQVDQPYVAFSDDDSWWGPGSLSRAIEFFEQHPRLSLITARILVGPEERLDPCCDLMKRSPLPNPPDLPGVPVLGFIACGTVVRRSAFMGVNGFNERFGTSGEEALLAIDLAKNNWGLSYVDNIVAHHNPSKVREMSSRLTQGVAVDLWTAWLRRSPDYSLSLTLKYFRAAFTDRKTRMGLLQAVRGLPWVWGQRERVSPELEKQLDLLETQREAI